MKKRFSHEEHLEFADHFGKVTGELTKMLFTLGPRYPSSGPVISSLERALGAVSKLRNKLDSEYHDVTSQEQFEQAGNVYYKMAQRWELDGHTPRRHDPVVQDLAEFLARELAWLEAQDDTRREPPCFGTPLYSNEQEQELGCGVCWHLRDCQVTAVRAMTALREEKQ
jgi:hypothetical protein